LEPVIRKCNKLRYLQLAECSSLNELSLAGVSQLRILNLSAVAVVSDKILATIASHSPRLKVLILLHINSRPSGNTLTDSGLIELGNYCSRLETLLLCTNQCKNDPKITAKGVRSLVQSTGNTLKRLQLSGISSINDPVLHSISCYCPNITFLCVSGCEKITNQGIYFLTKKCRKLQVLKIAKAPRLSNLCAYFVLRFCSQSLEELDVSGCGNLTDEFLQIIGNCIKLKLLRANGCNAFTSTGLHFLESCPNLKELHLIGCNKMKDMNVNFVSLKTRDFVKEPVCDFGCSYIYDINNNTLY